MAKDRHRMTPEVYRIAPEVQRMSRAARRTTWACPLFGLAARRMTREVAAGSVRSCTAWKPPPVRASRPALRAIFRLGRSPGAGGKTPDALVCLPIGQETRPVRRNRGF